MTEKEFKELKLLLLIAQMKKSSNKRIKLPVKTNGMENKGVIIHG